MRNHKAVGVAAVLTTVGALAVLYLSSHELPPDFDSRPHEAAGWGLAQQALRLVQPGGQITLITRDTADFRQPAVEVQLRSFTAALRQAHVKIAETRAIEVDPLRLVEVPSGDFLELIRKTPAGSVIVSLMGPPLLNDQEREQLGQVKPRIVAFCPGSLPAQIDLRTLFNQRLLDVAVVSRRDPAPSKPSGRQEWFAARFLTVTVTNVAHLYAAAGASP